MKIINRNGYALDYDLAVNMMDGELCEEIHAELAPCTEQEFFSAYEAAHAEKFGEEWALSKENPCW